MKYFLLICTLVLIGVITLGFIRHWDTQISFVVFAYSIVCLAIFDTCMEKYHEKITFEKPYKFSKSDSGKMMKIKKINGNKAGLVPFEYKGSYLGSLRDYVDYYFIDQIPKKLRNINEVFYISQSGDTMVFKKVIVNGFTDKTKKPFEILDI